MIAFGLFAGLAAAFAFLCLLINLAALALPVWIAGSIFLQVHRSGEGLVGSGFVGLVAGAATYFLGALGCALAPSRTLSSFIMLLYAMPAAYAGYHLGVRASQLVFLTSILQQICAVSLAIFIFFLSLRKLTAISPSTMVSKDVTAESEDSTILDADFTERPDWRSSQPDFPRQRERLQLPSSSIILSDED